MSPSVRAKGRLRYVWAGLLLLACGGVLSKPQGGGESHFLYRCVDECGGGLECVAELCTRSCLVGESSCADLLPTAICTDQSIEPGAIAVCDVGCQSASDCSGLGGGFECEAGFCRQPVIEPSPEPPLDAGMESGADAEVDGGGPLPGAPCTVGTAAVCAEGEVCGDEPGDECNPDVMENCPGVCFTPFRQPACSGLGPVMPCPFFLSCVVHPDSALSPEPVGYCVDFFQVGACSETMACKEGFVCDIEARVDKTSGDCVPEAVDCTFDRTGCVDPTPLPCPSGYTHADVDCDGPCVPTTTCACRLDSDCPADSVCDRSSGRCAPLPWKPPELCSLPFDPGPCDNALPMFAAVDGVCVEQTYGGCEGNDNRFYTFEECLQVCEGRPIPNPCPAGREIRLTSLDCDPPGFKMEVVCAEPCTTDEDCQDSGAPAPGLLWSCFDGVCQANGCA